jgi:hypothetical protein
MRPLKPLALLCVPAVALSLAACGADVQIGGDDIGSTSISADGHTWKVSDLHIGDDTATAVTQDGQTLTFAKVDGHWSRTR